MPPLRLRTVTRTSGANRALKEGLVAPADAALDFEEVPVLVSAFRRMVRGLDWDVCEMALTTYITARAHGVAFTALPVFLVRDFHHGAIQVNRAAGLVRGTDLEGHRVGVNRGYTVTTGVWARAILAEDHGCDLTRVTWVRSGDEHVAEFVPPPNVVDMEAGHDLAEDVASGVLPAAVGAGVEHPAVTTLDADPFAAGLAALKGRGLYPINHLVVVRDDVLAANPGLALDLTRAFTAAKDAYLAEVRAGRASDRVHLAAMEHLGDPLPYGIAPNLKVLETLMGHAVAQGIISAPMDIGGLFAAGTREFAG